MSREEDEAEHKALKLALKVVLEDLGSVTCAECSGYGHTQRDCMTYARIQDITAGNHYWKSILNTARSKFSHGRRVMSVKRRKPE